MIVVQFYIKQMMYVIGLLVSYGFFHYINTEQIEERLVESETMYICKTLRKIEKFVNLLFFIHLIITVVILILVLR